MEAWVLLFESSRSFLPSDLFVGSSLLCGFQERPLLTFVHFGGVLVPGLATLETGLSSGGGKGYSEKGSH